MESALYKNSRLHRNGHSMWSSAQNLGCVLKIANAPKIGVDSQNLEGVKVTPECPRQSLRRILTMQWTSP